MALVGADSVSWHFFLAWTLSRGSIQKAYVRHFDRLNRAAGALVGTFGVKLIVATAKEIRSS
ncbi:MAG TPA: hypothetical protein VMU33_10725 [Burkholderiaceae bacterium]|nr:hypothetical protein [Burkholderiaceae bacterium]